VEAIADGVDETSGKTESIEAPITIDLDVRIDPAPSIFTDNDIPPGVNVTSNETEVVETPTTIDPEAGVALAQGIAAYFDELYGIVDGVNETSGETEVIEAATTIDPEADTLNVIPDGVDVTPEVLRRILEGSALRNPGCIRRLGVQRDRMERWGRTRIVRTLLG